MNTLIKFQLGDVKSRLLNPNDIVGNSKASAVLRVACRAHPDGFKYSKRYRNGSWDGYVNLSDGVTFPTGLISIVVAKFNEFGANVEIDYGPYTSLVGQQHVITPDYIDGITLRDYQVEAAIKLLTSCRGIAKMATNAGKTETLSAILKYLDYQSITVVPTKVLMYQTAERISKRLGCHVGLVGDGKFLLEKHTVCIINSLVNKLKTSPEFVAFISDNRILNVDECHTTSESDRMLEAINAVPAVYRFGWSATPLKKDVLSDMRLIGMTGKVLYEVTNKQLIDAGYSAKPTVRLVNIDNDSQGWGLDYHSAYDMLVVKNIYRNEMIRRICTRHKGDVILIPVSRIAHGELLKDLIPGAMFASGESSPSEREEFEQAIRTTPGVYIACKIYDMGVDMPAVNVLIFAVGGKKENTQIQRMGRGLRAKPHDNTVTMYDFIDDTNKYLLEHSEARIDAYIQEGFHVEEATI